MSVSVQALGELLVAVPSPLAASLGAAPGEFLGARLATLHSHDQRIADELQAPVPRRAGYDADDSLGIASMDR